MISRILPAAVLLLAAILAFNCSGDDDDSGGGAADDDSADDTGDTDDSAPVDDSADDTSITDDSGTDDDGDVNCPDIVPNLEEPEVAEVTAGTFQLGSSDEEPGRETTETQHEVTLTRDFAVMKHEVTQSLYKAVMGEVPDSQWGCDEEYPTGRVSWDDAIAFANGLSEALGYDECYTVHDGLAVDWNPDCLGWRLPTEAEWEYAARAGTTDAYYTGTIVEGGCNEPALDDIAWYCGNSGSEMHEVGLLDPNDWGIYDILGNIWEWAWDGFDTEEQIPYSADSATDPTGPGGTLAHAYRGGGMFSQSMDCRVAKRRVAYSTFRDGDTAIRLVRTLPLK